EKGGPAVTPYGDAWSEEDFEIDGIEIVDDAGYALGYLEDEPDVPFVTSWDHETGELGAPIELFVPLSGPFAEADETAIEDLWGADALVDGTLITYLVIVASDGQDLEGSLWIAAIDPASGEATPLVDLTDAAEEGSDFYD